jgi:hypothetical protein
MKTKDLTPIPRSKSLKTTHHQKWGGGGAEVLALGSSENGKLGTPALLLVLASIVVYKVRLSQKEIPPRPRPP